jgi:hypothetical protein
LTGAAPETGRKGELPVGGRQPCSTKASHTARYLYSGENSLSGPMIGKRLSCIGQLRIGQTCAMCHCNAAYCAYAGGWVWRGGRIGIGILGASSTDTALIHGDVLQLLSRSMPALPVEKNNNRTDKKPPWQPVDKV